MSEKEQQLVLDNTKLVYYVLKQMHLYHKYDEFYDLGILGLVKGVKTFDESKNVALSTYLHKCIKNEILCYLRKKRPETISIETELTDNLTLEDTFEDCDINVENDIATKIIFEEVVDRILKLDYKSQFIITHYFGICGKKRLTQNEIAEALNVNQVYVSRKIKQILKNIKKGVNNDENTI